MFNITAVVFVVVEASTPKIYPKVTLGRARTLSGSVLRTLRGGERLPQIFCLVASSLGHLRSRSSNAFAKGAQGVCGEVEEICVQWSVSGSEAREEDRVRSDGSGHAVLGPGEPDIHLHCPPLCGWWIYTCPVDAGSRGCKGNGPRRVVGGLSDRGACELVFSDFFVSWHPQEGCRTRSCVEE